MEAGAKEKKEYGSVVVTMKYGEVCQIGEDVVIMIKPISETRTQVRVTAPKTMKISRLRQTNEITTQERQHE